MIAPPAFASIRDHVSRLGDVDFWWPYVAECLGRHGLTGAGREPVAGIGGTYPTFVCGDVVVKLFGFSRSWRKSHAAERAAHLALATDPEIVAPRLLEQGQLYNDPAAPWPYLITTRMGGVTWPSADFPAEKRLVIVKELGQQIKRIHALRPSGVATDNDWPDLDAETAARQSSLPPHLIAQIENYLARLGPLDRVFVHGDIMYRHVFVDNGHLTGLIDWGDALVTDRHYELAKLHLDFFDCDKTLLRAFLSASHWPVGEDFAQKAMALAIYRQALGLAQHHTMDVFHKIPATVSHLQETGTIDDLANKLFAV